MNKLFKCIGYGISLFLLQACAVDPAQVIPRKVASYETDAKPTPWEMQYAALYADLGKQARVNKPINLCHKNEVLYVKIHNHSSLNSDKFTDIVMSTLEKNRFFDEVVTRTPTIYINVVPEIAKKLPDGRLWYDLDDPLTIGQIKNLYPERNLMILEVRMQEFSPTGPLTVTVSLINAEDTSTLVVWRNSRNVWYSVEHTQVKDMMQDINRWLDKVKEICKCQCLTND